jgi:aspartate--ammonia ligase
MGVRVTKETLKSSSRCRPERLPQAAVPPDDPERRDPAVDRRRHRTGAHLHVLLRKAHLGECTVTVWPKQLKEICAERNINVLE